MTSFHEILKNGYNENRGDLGNYKLDKELSNNDHQVYYDGKNLLYNVTGTQNKNSNIARDWVNNLHLLTGIGFKKTNRYNDEKETLRKAKAKYKTDSALLFGHSQGAAYTSYISDPNKDKVYNLDKASTIGQKSRPHENNYAHKNDLVSLFTDRQKYFGNNNTNVLDAHNVDQSKELPLFF
jgi:hypothetical protein